MAKDIFDIIPPGNGSHRKFEPKIERAPIRRETHSLRIEAEETIEDIPDTDGAQVTAAHHEEPEKRNTDRQTAIEHNNFLERKVKREPLSVKTSGAIDTLWSKWRWIAGSLCILVIATIWGIYFRSATVSVIPKSERVVLNTSISASKEPKQDELGFVITTLTATETKEVAASGSKTVSSKATGKIVVYNEYSAKSQRLIKNTRFQTADGKIFRIAESINVPGITSVGGKSLPGNIEVTVYADEPGVAYNIGLSDFTVPGLKGDPRYSKVYARSKTSMVGGFSGAMRVVSDADLTSTKDELDRALRDRLINEARKAQPAEYVLYDDGVQIAYKPLERIEAGSAADKVTIRQEATLYAVLLNKEALAKAVAKAVIPNFDGAPVTLSNIEKLRAVITGKNRDNAWEDTQINVQLVGDAQIVWVVDIDKLKEILKGSARSKFDSIMTGFTNVDGATASVKPFWSYRTFPKDVANISIKLESPTP